MTYQVLTQKWRPQTFQEIVGQDHIIHTLINSISLERINHAYLFAGPHGTGKTSTARIFAKALNCEKGLTPSPCNKCSNCLEISRGESLDVLEIDGASNRGIDEVRDLRERVNLFPIKGRFKIYIIDEVHMLTNPAFNALLKTIEEPPSHVIFIFATTDPEKVPATIISRCQRFDFRKIGLFDILARLKQIVEKEKIVTTDESLQLIAKASESSMRDAEKILDQLISYTRGNIKEEDVIQLLGMVETEYLASFTENLYRREPLSNIKLLHHILREGKNPQWIVKDWLHWLRDLVMFKLGEKEVFSFPLKYANLLGNQSHYFSISQLMSFIEHLSRAEREIRFSSTPNIYLEVLMVKLCSFEFEAEKLKEEDPHLAFIYNKITALEEKIVNTGFSSFSGEVRKDKILQGEEKEKVAFDREKKEDNEREKLSLSKREEISSRQEEWLENWKMVVKGVKQKKRSLGGFLEKMKVMSVENNSIILGSDVNFLKETLEKRDNKQIIYEELKKFFPENFSLKFKHIVREKNENKESPSLREVVAQAIEIFEGEVINR